MKTWSEFYVSMRDYILSCPGNLLRFNAGDRAKSLLEAQATSLEELSFEADSEYANLYAPSASGTRLDARAAELGLARKPAQKATGWFTFEGAAETVIPLGTRVATGDTAEENVIEYLTTAASEIPVGETEVDVPIEAVAEGLAGNAAAGVVDTVIDTVPGITGGSNPSAVSGGADIETDDDLRSRCVLAPYRLARGIERHWESLAGDVGGVARAKCLACAPRAGAFQALVWSRDSEGRLVAADAPLLALVQAYLDDYALACVELTAEAPAGPLQDVLGYLEVADGQEYIAIVPAVNVALGAVFTGLVNGQTLTRAALIAAAMSVQYVTNYRLAVPAADFEPGVSEKVIAGLIQTLPMEWDGDYL